MNQEVISEIFKELSVIAYNLEDSYLKTIIDKFGLIPEEDILKQLKVYIIDLETFIDEEESSAEEDKFKRKFIKLQGDLIEIKYISRITPRDSYNELDGEMNYYIVINEVPDVVFSLQNTRYKFATKDERDKQIAKIATIFQKLDIIIKS